MIVTEKDWRYNDWPNFDPDEFACKHTGIIQMDSHFMDKIQQLRSEVGFALFISSGYRDPSHPVEVKKRRPGVHTLGLASDISCDGQRAYDILAAAFKLGFTGIGVSQKGDGRFVHVDTWTGGPRNNVWSY